MYRALFRCKLEYFRSVTLSCSKKVEAKIKSITCEALRCCLGLIKSTPHDIIFLLANEMPPDFRAELVTTKELIKVLYYNPEAVEDAIKADITTNGYSMVYAKHKNILDFIPKQDTQDRPPANKLNVFCNFLTTCGLERDKANKREIQEAYNNLIRSLRNFRFHILSTDAAI